MTKMKDVQIGGLTLGNDRPLTVVAGPCQIETADHAQMIAGRMSEACAAVGAQYVFKASYDKANRTSLSGKRGLGIEAGLKVLEGVRRTLGVPVLTDIHDAGQARAAAQVVDIIQIPAFLCRQTDLLLAAGETGAVVNIKKGQFLAPWDMANVASKVESTGNTRILLTERGVSFASFSATTRPVLASISGSISFTPRKASGSSLKAAFWIMDSAMMCRTTLERPFWRPLDSGLSVKVSPLM
jgi:2-dehydro-3-deoxyphosphooctonate aldolase (KDO 8-P synthase)